MSQTPLVFLDTETTGLQPDRHTPWEIAWITAIHDTETQTLEVADAFTSMVEIYPDAMSKADPYALKIGRFHERHINAVVPPRSPASIVSRLQADTERVSRLCNTHDKPHLVGAVPSFDHNMICANWTGWPGFGEGFWHYHLIDVEVLAAGRLSLAPPYTSDALCAALSVTVSDDDKHTAYGDTKWAMRLYAAVYDLTVVSEHPL